jgi:hypothetical protein
VTSAFWVRCSADYKSRAQDVTDRAAVDPSLIAVPHAIEARGSLADARPANAGSAVRRGLTALSLVAQRARRRAAVNAGLGIVVLTVLASRSLAGAHRADLLLAVTSSLAALPDIALSTRASTIHIRLSTVRDAVRAVPHNTDSAVACESGWTVVHVWIRIVAVDTATFPAAPCAGIWAGDTVRKEFIERAQRAAAVVGALLAVVVEVRDVLHSDNLPGDCALQTNAVTPELGSE